MGCTESTHGPVQCKSLLCINFCCPDSCDRCPGHSLVDRSLRDGYRSTMRGVCSEECEDDLITEREQEQAWQNLRRRRPVAPIRPGFVLPAIIANYGQNPMDMPDSNADAC